MAYSRNASSGGTASRQLAQNLKAALECAVVDGVRDAEMGIASREHVAGNDQNIMLDRLGDELAAGAPGCLGEGVESPFGTRQLEIIDERFDHHVALAAISVD